MKQRFLETAFLFSFACIPLIWLRGAIILGHDSVLRPTVDFFLKNYGWYSWNPHFNTGVDTSLFHGLPMITFPELFFQLITQNFHTAQMFVFVFWFILMIFSMYTFLAYVWREEKYWLVRISGSLLFAMNFFILQAWFVVERTKFSLYAALPLFLLLMVLVFRRKLRPLAGGVSAGLLYVFLNGGGSPSHYGATVLLWCITFLFFGFIDAFRLGWRGISYWIKMFVYFVVSFLLFNLYWIYPQIELFTGRYDSGVSAEGGIQAILGWEKEISKLATYTNLFRLQGIPDWSGTYHQYASVFMNNQLFSIVSFLFLAVILLGFSLKMYQKADQQNKYILSLCLLFLVIGIPFAAGSQPPFGFLYNLALQYLPGFAIFRSSFYKFAPLMFFSFSILFAYSIWYLSSLIRYNNVKKIFSFGVVVIVLIYHWPFFTTTFFQFDKVYTTRVKVPEYIYSVSDYITNEIPSEERIAVLPPLDTTFIGRAIDGYTWGFNSLDILPRIMTKNTIIANDSRDSTVQLLYNAWRNNKKDDFHTYAEMLGITHVLFREDSFIADTEVDTLEKQKKRVDIFFGQPVKKEGLWSVYNVQPYGPVITWNKQFVLSGNFIQSPSFFAVKSGLPVIQTEKGYRDAQSVIAYEFECLFCDSGSYEGLFRGIIIPTPESRFKQIVKKLLPERLQREPERREEKIDQILSQASTELGYIRSDGFQNALSVQNYKNYMEKLMRLFSELSEKSKFYYGPRITAFLTTHKTVLEQLNSNSELLPFIKENLAQAVPYIYVSDQDTQRYILDLPHAGTFQFVSNSTASAYVNEKLIHDEDVLVLPAGVHKLATKRTQEHSIFGLLTNNMSSVIEREHVQMLTDTQTKKKVKYSATASGLLLFPQSFDGRWVVNGEESKALHVKVNGYANGWILPAAGDKNILSIEYLPQKTFLQTLFISGISFFIEIVILFAAFKRKQPSFPKNICTRDSTKKLNIEQKLNLLQGVSGIFLFFWIANGICNLYTNVQFTLHINLFLYIQLCGVTVLCFFNQKVPYEK